MKRALPISFICLGFAWLPFICLPWIGLTSTLMAGESALRFNGAQVLTAPPLPLGSHTLEVWIRPDGPLPLPSRAGVLFDWDGRVRLTLSITGLNYEVDLGGSKLVHVVAQPLEPGEWYHVAASFNGERMRVVVNGKIAAFQFVAGTIAGAPTGTLSFGASRSGLADGAPLVGTMDELRLWNRDLSVQSIEEYMNDHLPAGTDGLLAYWDLDQGTGPTTKDQAGGLIAVLGDNAGVDPEDPLWTSEIAPIRKPDSEFNLRFVPPGPISAGSGKMIDISCVLDSALDTGAQGVRSWSIAVRHNRRSLVLQNLTLDNTAADLLDDGFAFFEYLDDGDKAGFVSVVVLSETGRVALPPVGSAFLARASYRGLINSSTAETAVIRFDNRLPESTRGNVPNVVQANGREYRPLEGRLELQFHAPDFRLDMGPERRVVPPGAEFALTYTLTTSNNEAPSGPSAWSIGVAHDPNLLELLEVTNENTVIDDIPPDANPFLLTERVDNETGTGFISVAILSFSTSHALPPNGEATISRARYRVLPTAELDSITDIVFLDGLRGSGFPIRNHVDFIGGSAMPEMIGVNVSISISRFIRGDTNGDFLHSVGDVITSLNAFFLGGPPLRCNDAADANDDSRLNIVDPIYLLNFLFKAGDPPKPPFPGLDADPTDDQLDCQQYP